MKRIRTLTIISVVSTAMAICMFVMCLVYAQKALNMGAGINVYYSASMGADGAFTENLEGTFLINGVVNKYYDMNNGCSDTPVTNTLSNNATLAPFNVGNFDFSDIDLTPKTYEFRFKLTDVNLLKLDNEFYQKLDFNLSSNGDVISYKGAVYVKGPNWDSSLTIGMSWLEDDWECAHDNSNYDYYYDDDGCFSEALYNIARSYSTFAAFETFVLDTYFLPIKITYTNATSSLSSQSGTITDGETAEAKVLIEYTGEEEVELSLTSLTFNFNIVREAVAIE